MDSILDIFNQDAFSTTTLTTAMRDIKYIPSFVGSLGLFQTTNISTLDVAIEKDKEGNVFIVPSSPRGGPGKTFGKNRRSMRKLSVPHFQVDDAIYADEVQAARAFGEAAAVETFMGKIANRGAEISQSFALTEEYHRLTVLTQAKLLDADGSTLYDYEVEMGESLHAEIDFDLDNATPTAGSLRKQCAAVTRIMASQLDGIPFNGLLAICGDNFFDDLIAHSEVRDTYKGYEAAATLRTAYINNGQNGTFGMFEFGGILWVNYRSGQTVGVHTDKCHIVPMGTPGIFKSVFAPADYIETVNRPGQRLYAKLWRMPNDKGMNLEYQSNVLHYCTRPKVLLRGKRT